jgi:hypothetical protein
MDSMHNIINLSSQFATHRGGKWQILYAKEEADGDSAI